MTMLEDARSAWDEACGRAEDAGRAWNKAGSRREGPEHEAWKAACSVSARTSDAWYRLWCAAGMPVSAPGGAPCGHGSEEERDG